MLNPMASPSRGMPPSATDELSDIMKEVVAQCSQRRVAVSQVMAAFVIRMLVENDQGKFSLDQQLTQDALKALIEAAVDRLTAHDDPALETIKMQVEYDSAYFDEEEALDSHNGARDRKAKELGRKITQAKPKHATDFETINDVYRDIFRFILHDHQTSTGPSDDERSTVEREVAAALESVFPRIGVRGFTQLAPSDKQKQLGEISQVVLGIRMLNKALDKGGAGLSRVDQDVAKLVADLRDEIAKEVEFLQELCLQYQETLVHAHMSSLRNQHTLDLLQTVDRLKDELANRRQLHAYLQGVQEDVLMSSKRSEQLLTRLRQEMTELKQLVGGRSTVPKEQVYPRFDSLASVWKSLGEEYQVLQARQRIYQRLTLFRGSFKPIFSSRLPLFKEAVEAQQAAQRAAVDQDEALAAAAVAAEHAASIRASLHAITSAAKASSTEHAEPGGEGKDGESGDGGIPLEEGDDVTPDSRGVRISPNQAEDMLADASAFSSGDRPVKLSMATTPEFMQLPLEYQGFCAWTILNRRGLLLPGKPALGVVRYKNAFYVFAHDVALKCFMQRPEEVLSGMHEMAKQHPELIHLLRMQDQFPDSMIRSLLRGGRPKGPKVAGIEVKNKADASTGTPLHFNSRNKDYSYEWNEWELRRRALKLIKLRKCRTVSQQTDASHFRRDNDSQVYLPKTSTTQTVTSRGTNPPKTLNYLAGLRHSVVTELGEPRPLNRPSVYVKKTVAQADDVDNAAGERDGGEVGGSVAVQTDGDKPGLVQLTYEHQWEPSRRK